MMTTASSSNLTLFCNFFLLAILLFTVPTAQAETLSLATQTHNRHSVVVYTAKPLTPTPAPSELPLEIWAAANGLLSSYYPSTKPKQYATQSWPETVVINGLTLEVNPGRMPTLKPASAETPASTSARSTSAISTPRPTSSATPRDDDGGDDGDRTVGIVLGVGISFVALAMLLVIMGLLWRRKNSTGTFFKPARYSISSVMTETIKGRLGGESWMSPMRARQLEKRKQLEEGGEAAPSPTIYRVSTIRAVDLSSPPESVYSNRRSVERLRSRKLVSRGMWTEVKPHELEGDQAARAELSAESPTEKAAYRKTQSSGTLRQVFEDDDGDATPRPRHARSRPLVVTMSPTTSSSGILDSRLASRDGPAPSSSGQGESRDEITPIVTPIPSYRDRRPADLLLPSATNRFRDQRLAPLVHFQDESPGVSPLYRSPGISNSPSPNFRTNGFSPSPSPGIERRVSPVVHYPSWDEVRGFEFTGGDSTPRRPSYTSLTDGGDGWQPGGDSVFGRYEMA